MEQAVTVVEAVGVALVLGSTAWVLGVQPMGLLRRMSRDRFVPLQIRLVKIWASALVPAAAVMLLGAAARRGADLGLAPAAIGLLGAMLTAWWAIPRALPHGGEAIRDGAEGDLSSAEFLLHGGGAGTRIWHRIVLATAAMMIGGAALDGAQLVAPSQPGGHDHHHVVGGAPTDAATARNVAAMERKAATLVASAGNGDLTALNDAWSRIFRECTLQGEDHERLHAFLTPIDGWLGEVAAAQGEARLPALRRILGHLGGFSDTFAADRPTHH